MGFEKLIVRVLHGVHVVARPMTLGVRGVVSDNDGRICLVRHTYVSGWYLPGGGVDPGETAADAMAREVREEVGLVLVDPPRLVSAHFNRSASNRDHVLFYRCGAFRREGARKPSAEIAEMDFFALDDLPDGTTDATLRRLAELAGEAAPDPYW
ncbi:NUDIX domain-containing protein [Aurantimonas sp. A2-1-M11]|uniref:NUDIX domain-containing protein n=1 Tax=Aurantimonas sp. A2-1-M11 TaxID=3113712 RepID=UPI002F959F0A